MIGGEIVRLVSAAALALVVTSAVTTNCCRMSVAAFVLGVDHVNTRNGENITFFKILRGGPAVRHESLRPRVFGCVVSDIL